jgi:hypothetical protein
MKFKHHLLTDKIENSSSDGIPVALFIVTLFFFDFKTECLVEWWVKYSSSCELKKRHSIIPSFSLFYKKCTIQFVSL